LLISFLGQKLVRRLHGVSDSHGRFKRGLGLLFLLVGVFIITGLDKKVEEYILNTTDFNVTTLEETLFEDVLN